LHLAHVLKQKQAGSESSASSETGLTLGERLQVVIDSTKEVLQPAVFGVFIIMLVFLPIFFLDRR